MILRISRRISLVFLSCAALLAATGADAGLFRTYLSVNGDDANACTLAAPCRLLPAALAAVNDGGEIWMLDSANYNVGAVAVTKSVTILAVPGAIGSVLVNGGYAIDINTAGVKVTLRNLLVRGLTGVFYGIRFAQGASLTVEDCELFGLPNTAIAAYAPASMLVIRNTMIRNSATGIGLTGTVTATLDGVHLIGNGGDGFFMGDGVTASLSNSVIIGHTSSGVLAQAIAPGGTIRLQVERSVLQANGNGIYAAGNGAGSVVQVSATHNSILGSTVNGVAASASGGTATVVLDDNAVVSNATGAQMYGTGVVKTRLNNTFRLNGTDVLGGSLATSSAQ
jgi:hypothetical protein